MKTFKGIAEVSAAQGVELGTTDWLLIDQSMIAAFAEATGDRQWIHVDVDRAKSGLFGGTIAHGFLTLSLLPGFFAQLYKVEGVAMAINYGLGKVRFPSPVPSGSRVNATGRIAEVIEVPGGVQCTLETVIAIDGGSKPACVAESIVRFLA
jgi:acyl dehydratase